MMTHSGWTLQMVGMYGGFNSRESRLVAGIQRLNDAGVSAEALPSQHVHVLHLHQLLNTVDEELKEISYSIDTMFTRISHTTSLITFPYCLPYISSMLPVICIIIIIPTQIYSYFNI